MRLLALAHSIVREGLKSLGRSPHWSSVRDTHLLAHGACAACGGKDHLQVHHVRPFHLEPRLELDPGNLLTLCMGRGDCHLALGHGGSFSAFDPAVLEHAARYRAADAAGRAWVVAEARAGRLRIT